VKDHSTVREKLGAKLVVYTKKIMNRGNPMERTSKTYKSEINNVKEYNKKSLTTNVFFDENSEFYGNATILESDIYFINFIKRENNLKKSFLDIGGGSGIFSSFLKRNCSELEVTLVDPSLKMLEKNCDKTFVKYQGQLPNKLNIPEGKKFNYILIKEVLHHITGKSINESKELVIESLKNSKNLMEDNGYLMIHELFYESYLFQTLARNCIFYLLKIQKIIRFKFLPNEFLSGLSVCFYTRTELQHFFQQCGFVIIDTYKEDWANNLKKQILLLRNWGRILYILKKFEGDQINL
jgi:2-polyprenyl-3-methyl-5-hydroxy-6-metoxy-1,4-benzoquinol methylase